MISYTTLIVVIMAAFANARGKGLRGGDSTNLISLASDLGAGTVAADDDQGVLEKETKHQGQWKEVGMQKSIGSFGSSLGFYGLSENDLTTSPKDQETLKERNVPPSEMDSSEEFEKEDLGLEANPQDGNKENNLPPSQAKTCTSFFEVGNGQCLDGKGRPYSWFVNYPLTLDGCKSKCESIETPGLVGIDHYDSGRCDCLFHDGLLPSPCPSYQCYTDGGGYGRVKSSNNNDDGSKCYRAERCLVH